MNEIKYVLMKQTLSFADDQTKEIHELIQINSKNRSLFFEREDKISSALENLKAVLCGPEGNACIQGSAEDLRIIDSALAVLSERIK